MKRKMEVINGTTKKEAVFEAIFRTCEKKGAIQPVNAEYYEDFINMSEKKMKTIMVFILRSNAEYVNKKCIDEEDEDFDVSEIITMFLDYMSLGIAGPDVKSLKMVFFKPVGPPPSKEMKMKIQNRIKEFVHNHLFEVIKEACTGVNPENKQ